MWVPANVITECRNDLGDDAKALQAEARHRFEQGYGIRVFSRPQKLKDWLAAKGIPLEDRAHLITDAGQEPPEFTLYSDGLVFFAHSPFAWRQDNGEVVDRNGDSLVVQARFQVGATETKVILGSDADHWALSDIVRLTKRHKREEKLLWDVFKLPHHCSYLTLGPDKGDDKTVPVPDVKWLFEDRGQRGGVIVSTSWPIPAKGSKEDEDPQPPHRQAAAYYEDVEALHDGEFVVTMAHPKPSSPEPLVIEIDGLGARVKKVQAVGAVAITTTSAPRAG